MSKKSEKKCVLISTGGTAGHVFPATALARELERHKVFTPHIVCDQRGSQWLDKLTKPLSTSIITTARWSRRPADLIKFPFLFMRSLLQAYCIFKSKKPKIVVGFGGYASCPIMLLARLTGVPFIIHEQNSVLGLVNRMFAPNAEMVAISFPRTIELDDDIPSVFLGNPVREEFISNKKKAAKRAPNKADDAFKILVLGGSQGAKMLSYLVPATLARLEMKQRRKIQVTMQTRPELSDETEAHFKAFAIKCEVRSFFDNVPELMQSHDLLICRSGASTIAEITALGAASILVPFPHAADDHQTYNAQYLVDNEAAIIIQEKDWMNQALGAIKKMLNDRSIGENMGANAKRLAKVDAAVHLAALVEKFTA